MNAVMPSLAGLNERIRVRTIAAFDLLTCTVSENVAEVSSGDKFDGIDQIPIVDGERIVAVWERASNRNRFLDDSLLVSADAPLWDFIHTLHQQPYRLVVDKTRIAGIVTWSDLLKLPVFVLAFSLLAELELAMNRRIGQLFTHDSWVGLLDDESQKMIRGRQAARKRANVDLEAIEAADLWQKATVLRSFLGAGRDFETDLEKVRQLRNDVDHVKDMVKGTADLARFVEHLETAEVWLKILKQAEAATAAGA